MNQAWLAPNCSTLVRDQLVASMSFGQEDLNYDPQPQELIDLTIDRLELQGFGCFQYPLTATIS